MSFYPNTGRSFCERCGHSWISSKYDNQTHSFIEPKSCGKCKSKGWNVPRVYGGKYLNGSAPMARRFKPTGRAASKTQFKPRTLEILKFLAKAPSPDKIISRVYTNPELVFGKGELPQDKKKKNLKLKKILSDNEKSLIQDINRYNQLINESGEMIESRMEWNSVEGNLMLKCNHITYHKMLINAALELLGFPKRYKAGLSPSVNCPNLRWEMD